MSVRPRLATVALATTLVVLYSPLAYLLVSSVNRNPLSTSWQGFTTGWYRDALGDPGLRRAFSVSVRLALLGGLASVVVGTAAVLAFRRTRRVRRLGLALATARIATPEVILATGLASVIPAAGLRFGLLPMLCGHVALLSGYVVLIVAARAAGADPHLEEAALDLGARRWQAVRDVVLPDLRPAIVAALLLSMSFSFDDLALSLALRGPDDTTVPVYVFSVVQRRVTPSIHALGAMVTAIGVTSFAAASIVHRSLAPASGSNRSG